MITGYNTDIRHGGLVFHVQTEDKGVGNPCVESLIYVGGRILARERSGYRRLLELGRDRKAIVDLMESQHQRMIEEIRSGKLDERLVAMGTSLESTPSAPEAAGEEEESLLLDEAQAAEEDGPSLDQVILEYLNSEARQEHLVLVMNTDGELHPGRSSKLSFHAETSREATAVADARIRVKLISTTSEPIVLGEAVTDAVGDARLELELPAVEGGAAALIVSAESSVGKAELKHLI